MLESILQGLREVEGVQGAMIVDSAAAIVAHRAHSIYDLGVLHQVARSVVSSIDSVQLIQDDWDMLTAHFGDGKLLLRSLRTSGNKPRRYILAVIADATLNTAFLGVALRVAASKLLVELETPDEHRQLILAGAHDVLRLQHVQACVRNADSPFQQVDLRRHAGRMTRLRLFQQPLC